MTLRQWPFSLEYRLGEERSNHGRSLDVRHANGSTELVRSASSGNNTAVKQKAQHFTLNADIRHGSIGRDESAVDHIPDITGIFRHRFEKDQIAVALRLCWIGDKYGRAAPNLPIV